MDKKEIKEKLEKLENEAKELREKNPQMDFTIITERPEGMSRELYKFMRKLSNKTIRNYIRRV